ncbi:hypothetical protein [Actinokineospora sp.]|uniref:hypothetical protein n=1 Tax=Actinokineospora sp. TaxID=1872133 RepID=UPI003D6AC57E
MRFLLDNPLFAVIALCEIGFWVLLGAGLVARYPLRLRRTGAALLVATPIVDLVLLAATVLDLRRGGEAGLVHGLGAAYLGFSVAFGPSLIRWADRWFAYRFADGPRPVRVPKRGPERARHEWREWGKCVMACGIGVAVLAVLSFVVGTPERTTALWSGWYAWIPKLGAVTAIWFATGPLWTLLDRGEQAVMGTPGG